MLEEIIEKIRPIVLELFKDEKSGHDITHLERVYNTALYLQEQEGGGQISCWSSCLFA